MLRSNCFAQEPRAGSTTCPLKAAAQPWTLANFTTDADPASQTLVEVLCEDHVGTYLLPFLCRLTPEGLRNERTGESIEGRVVGWREPKPSSRR